ncbi:hypothetical protein BT69DRAFT_432803 [Atractiella rhizophila]|nr:hypothetical protein BT69DRAFT_432803 [Atractiella rhizophila]
MFLYSLTCCLIWAPDPERRFFWRSTSPFFVSFGPVLTWIFKSTRATENYRMMRLPAFLKPAFRMHANPTKSPPLLQDVSGEPHTLSKSLFTGAQFVPTRETDKFMKVSYRDHLRKDLELLPLNVVVPFWPEILIDGEVLPESPLSAFLLDMTTLLRYMYQRGHLHHFPSTLSIRPVLPMESGPRMWRL